MEKIAENYIVSKGYGSPEQAREWIARHGWESVMEAAERGERPEKVVNQSQDPTYEEIVRFLNARRTFLEAGGRIGRAKEIGYILDRLAAHKLVDRDINS